MKLPLKWLKEYVDYNVTHEEFVEKMMWRGFEVASVDPELPDVSGVVVGRIERIENHPDAEKLHVCTVAVNDDANDCCTIVCGAQNIFEGALIPVALPGAKLPGGIVIEPVVMRGVKSNGMLCSGKELGITDADYPGSEVHGLLILQGEHPLGQPIAEAVGMDGVVFDIELTPNRADCQSIIGMCREVAAALGQRFEEPEIKPVAGVGHAADYASVSVENADLCPRYAARVVTDINIAPSPDWMQKKLRSVGLRPINNIVDITNFVMTEYGHPMHAFDLACVTDGHIVVRNAKENEVVRTLDSKDRAVEPSMLLIADPVKGVGIAGVMGGENSEIKPETKAVLFEAAVFKNSNIRQTARKLRHMTDAAAHFIKGVEAVNAKNALDRAIELVEELHAGKVVGDTIDVCAAELADREIVVSCAHINRLLNTVFSAQEMTGMLDTINIRSVPEGEDGLRVYVPHYRVDIESGIEADWDIAEEIGRIYGYYNIQPTLMRGDTFRGKVTEPFKVDDLIKDTLAAQGGYEMYNYNFTAPAALEALKLSQSDERRQTVRILNPFGEDQSLMRTTLLPGMLRSAETNLNRRTGHGRFFEVGNVHFNNNDELPEERKMVGLIYFGAEEDFFTLKGSIEQLLDALHIRSAQYVCGDAPEYHPGRQAKVIVSGETVGVFGEVHPDVRKAFGIDERVYAAELSFAKLLALRESHSTYKPLPRYPVVQRDLAVVVPESISAAEVKAVIQNAPVDVLLENVELFDVYRGKGILSGMKSMAYTFTLRLEDRTLTDEDISTAFNAVIHTLRETLNAELRA